MLLEPRTLEWLVQGEDYKLCEEASRRYWANQKTGAYGKGLGRTAGDQYKPVRTGLLGEMAWARLFCEPPPDFQYRKGGDGGADFRTGDFSWDIKVAMRDYGTGLIYHKNEWGKVIPLKADIYVFGFVAWEDREAGARVVLVGFATREQVPQIGEIKPGRKGSGHLNWELPYSRLGDIIELRRRKLAVFGPGPRC